MNIIPKTIKKIGIFRALQLGDMLCAIPAIRSLRKAFPHAEITLLGLPWATSLVERFPTYFNKFLHFPGYEGLPEQEFDEIAYNNFVSKVQQEAFDLLLQMQGNGTIVNKLMTSWNAEILAGFYPAGDHRPSPLFVEYPDQVHEIERHLRLTTHLGIASTGTALEFPLTTKDTLNLEAIKLLPERHSYVCVHPGSRGTYRQWPPELFAEAANRCYRLGYQVVLTGTGNEQEIVDQVAGLLQCPWINACGKTNLGSAALLIADAALLVSNCTGVAHISAAVQTPSVIISMDGEPERWGPLNKQLHTTINWLADSDPEKVFKAIVKLLKIRAAKQPQHARIPGKTPG